MAPQDGVRPHAASARASVAYAVSDNNWPQSFCASFGQAVVLRPMIVCTSWYVLAGHAEHVRRAVLLSAEMRSPPAHVACAAHEVSRWLVLLWYVLAPHAEHVRMAVLVSALILKPAPHVGCAVHEVARLSPTLYVLAPHAEHVRKAVLVSALILKPATHVGCTEQVLAPAAEYSSAPHLAFLLLVHL